ncbi:MAG: hypothetical protein JEZ07_12455 [Phycisphaerae bacterium]|nr:hypothetical protein [Phycisphaerae bacterium]
MRLIILFCFTVLLAGCFQTKILSSSKMFKDGDGIEPVPFKAVGLETVKKTIGRFWASPHEPSSAGNRTYKFKGKINFNNQKITLNCYKFRPKSLVKIDMKYYLLGEDYFSSGIYHWFEIRESASEFVPIELSENSFFLMKLPLNDMEKDRIYKISWLSKLCNEYMYEANEQRTHELAYELFKQYIDDNPGVFYSDRIGQEDTLDNLFSSMFSGRSGLYYLNSHKTKCINSLIKMLMGASPKNNPLEIKLVLNRIIELDRQKQDKILTDFLKKLEQGNFPHATIDILAR